MTIKQSRTLLYKTLKEEGWPETTKEKLLSIISEEDLNALEENGIIEPDIRNPKAYFINWKATLPRVVENQDIDNHLYNIDKKIDSLEEKINDIYEILLRFSIKENLH